MKKSPSNSSFWMRNEINLESTPLVLKLPKSYGAVLPYYQFIKATINKATSSQTLNRSESMVSLCFRSLTSFVLDDNLPGLQAFLENKQVQVDDKDENGTTALMVAASKGRPAFIWELLSHGADPNAEDQDGWSALLCAAKEGYTDICCTLLENGALIEHRDMGGWTALMWASYKGHTDTVILLLERGADCNAHGNFHISSLLWASGRGHTRIVQELIQRSAKVNVGDKYGTTALVWASRKGHTEIVDILLKAGANVDTAGMYSWTALLVATQHNHVDIVNLLLEYKPNVNALDKDGCTALTIACKEGFYEIATALLNANAYINIQDRMGDTNLIHAVKAGHRGIVEALLKKYADVDVCGKDRKTAIYTAVEKGNSAIVRMLLAANPDLEISTKDGDTPLLRAVRTRNAEIVQLLLDKRAKVSATDRKGDTVLHIAMRARSKAIVEILLRNPKNSQLLYRPNKQGETAYNIDLNHQKQILGQVFGARRLNTNEDNENMLGYDLYSSALADMLSEPSLSMPITVGLYAKWGSGKSFLLNKLREEMKNFARQWVDPVFHFSSLLFLCIIHISIVSGTLIGIALLNWFIGLVVGATLFLLIYVFLAVVWFLNQRYDWDWPYSLTVNLTRKLNSLRLILQVTFCHPPSMNITDSNVTAQPIRFYFTDQTRVSSTTGGENSVVQMLGSLYDAIESNYGAFATRLYRAFKPKPVKSSSSWRLRRLCCLPYAVIFELCLLCLLIGICTLTVYIVIKTDVELQQNITKDNNLDDTLGTVTLHVVLITIALLLGITSVANLYTWGRVFAALIFSQRTQLRRAIAKLDTLKSEGFQQTLTQEVTLMKDMVKCLDSLSSQQTRLVVIVDGLDSCEQDKVLLVLDAVHMLFSDTNSPFIVILAIDPHVISKAVEMNSRRLFNESNIGGHDYLRNLVHLPFFLQNSGLRKVKIAQQTAQAQHRKQISLGGSSTNYNQDWSNQEDANILVRSLSNRRLSTESTLMSSCEKLKPPAARKGSRKLKVSESIASSIGSNLNMVVGAHDLTKMLLTDDYFSDVNPRSMRRLMNVVYVTGRLLKAFQIDFNWYHLASWINITEQWPYRTSWIIFHYDLHEDQFEDNTSLKILYDKIRPKIPTLKEVEPLLELDRDEKKFDIFLTFHRSSLLVSDLKIFLPFTINLDPYIKKVIKEEYQQNCDDMQSPIITPTPTLKLKPNNSIGVINTQWNDWTNTYNTTPNMSKSVMLQRNRQKHHLYKQQQQQQLLQQQQQQQQQQMNWGPQPAWSIINAPPGIVPAQPYPPLATYSLSAVSSIPSDVLDTKLSTLSVNGVCKLFEKIEELNPNALSQYTSVIKQNNINGRVLLHCDLDELKKLLNMNFGDWEMFRVLIVSLREHELTLVYQQDEGKNVRSFSETRERKSSNPKSHSHNSEREQSNKPTENTKARVSNKQSIMEKQVTLEDQMICGALQTLNEEACEDVLEESIEVVDPDIPQTTLIPPSPDQSGQSGQLGNEVPFEFTSGGRSRTSSTNGVSEADFVILQPATYNKYGWSPVVGVASGSMGTIRDSCPPSENSSVCSTPRARRKVDMGLFFQDCKKSVDNNYITIDLKPMVDSTKQLNNITSKTTEHIKSSMYGQNSKHNIGGCSSPRPSSLHVASVASGANGASGTSSTNAKFVCVRSKSVEDNRNNKTKKNNLNHIKVKFAGSGPGLGESVTPTPTSSLEKLTKLKEKLMQASTATDNRELPTNVLDSDDESTPLVSDLSTPSVSLGPESPPQQKHFENKAFSPKSPENSSPSQQFSSPEAEHKNDNNLTDSTDFSPISPIRDLVNANVNKMHNVSTSGGKAASTQLLNYLTPPQSYSQEMTMSGVSSNTSSNLSLSNYLEASNSNTNSRKLNMELSKSKSDSLASVASFASDYTMNQNRRASNLSNLSRQNALDKEEQV